MNLYEIDTNEEIYIGNWVFNKELLLKLLTTNNLTFENFKKYAYPQLEINFNDSLLEKKTKRAPQSRTYKEIISAIDPGFLKHAKRAAELGIARPANGPTCSVTSLDEEPPFCCNGTISFVVNSSKFQQNGKKYINRMQITEWDQLVNDSTLKPQDAAKLIIWAGHVRLHCTCHSFLFYGFQYILTQLGLSLFPENRPPNIRNPGRQGIVCKHLNRSLRVFPNWWTSYASEIKKARLELSKNSPEITDDENETPEIETHGNRLSQQYEPFHDTLQYKRKNQT